MPFRGLAGLQPLAAALALRCSETAHAPTSCTEFGIVLHPCVHNLSPCPQLDTNSAETFLGLATVQLQNADGSETLSLHPATAPEEEVESFLCRAEYHTHGNAFKPVNLAEIKGILSACVAARGGGVEGAVPASAAPTAAPGSSAADLSHLKIAAASGPAVPKLSSPGGLAPPGRSLMAGGAGGAGASPRARGLAPALAGSGTSADATVLSTRAAEEEALLGRLVPQPAAGDGKFQIRVGPNRQAILPSYQGPRPAQPTAESGSQTPHSVGLGGKSVEDAGTALVAPTAPDLTPGQELAFMEGFNRFGKEFHRIAADMAGVSTGTLVAHYYKHKSRRAVLARERHEKRHGAPQPDEVTLGGGEKRDVVPVELVCMRRSCGNTVSMRQYNAHRVLYRARTQCNPSWRSATKNPFWLCLDCFPAPDHALRQGLYSYAGAEDEGGRSRKRRRAAVLADAERLAREYQHGGRFSMAADSMYDIAPDGQVPDNSGMAASALNGVRAAIMQAQLSVKDSVELVHRVRQVYGAESPRFRRFLSLLFRYQRRALSVRGLAARVLRLFRKNPPILKAFAVFLPPVVREAFVRGMQHGLKATAEAAEERERTLQAQEAAVHAANQAGDSESAAKRPRTEEAGEEDSAPTTHAAASSSASAAPEGDSGAT